MKSPSVDDIEVPRECLAIKRVHQKSGLTVADLAAATGLGISTVHVALNGVRYRGSEAKVTVPSDRTLVRLASALGLTPKFLRGLDRDRAADLLAEAADAGVRPSFAADQDAQAAVAARSALTRQILAVFSTEEIRAELLRRDQLEQDEENRKANKDHWDTLQADRYPR